MKTKIYISAIAFLLLGVITACQKDQYYYFNDESRLQFGPPNDGRNYGEFADTAKTATFYYEESDVQLDTVYFDIYTIGETSQIDRTYSLRQVQASGAENAIPNKHYVAFDDADMKKLLVITAGSVHARVPILIKRDPELKAKTVALQFEVEENSSFKPGEKSKVWRKLYITDRLSQPNAWDATTTQYYFGPYSTAKHSFMIEITGQKWDQDFFLEIRTASDLINYWKSVLSTALIKYNNEHAEPLKDENGAIIFFP